MIKFIDVTGKTEDEALTAVKPFRLYKGNNEVRTEIRL